MTSLFIPLTMFDSDETVGILGVLLPIIISLGAFLMIFGLNYLKSRERMALIERGIDPTNYNAGQDRTFAILRSSLLFIGVGIGLLVAFFITESTEADGGAIYFPMIFIFGGLGLLAAYLIERRRQKRAL